MALITHACGHQVTYKVAKDKKALAARPCPACAGAARQQSPEFWYVGGSGLCMSSKWRGPDFPDVTREEAARTGCTAFDTEAEARAEARRREEEIAERRRAYAATPEGQAEAAKRQLIAAMSAADAPARAAALRIDVPADPAAPAGVNPDLARAIRDDPNWTSRDDADEVLFGET